MTLAWQPPPDDQQNGVIRHYIVTVMEDETGRNYSVVASQTEHVVGDLHPFYTYFFAVSAVTIAAGPFTDEFMVITLEDGKFHRFG